MMRSILAGMLFLGAASVAVAQDQVPDFTGTWSGEFDVILKGRDPGSKGQVVKADVTYDLVEQDGRLIWGEVSSDKTKRRSIVLAFSLNNGTLVGSDTEGLHRLTVISSTWMESCFTDNGDGAILASCGMLHKVK